MNAAGVGAAGEGAAGLGGAGVGAAGLGAAGVGAAGVGAAGVGAAGVGAAGVTAADGADVVSVLSSAAIVASQSSVQNSAASISVCDATDPVTTKQLVNKYLNL